MVLLLEPWKHNLMELNKIASMQCESQVWGRFTWGECELPIYCLPISPSFDLCSDCSWIFGFVAAPGDIHTPEHNLQGSFGSSSCTLAWHLLPGARVLHVILGHTGVHHCKGYRVHPGGGEILCSRIDRFECCAPGMGESACFTCCKIHCCLDVWDILIPPWSGSLYRRVLNSSNVLLDYHRDSANVWGSLVA